MPYYRIPVLVHERVWVHIPGDPQSVQLRNTTTTSLLPREVSFIVMTLIATERPSKGNKHQGLHLVVDWALKAKYL